MNVNYDKPLPIINEANREFWNGCKNGDLKMQECNNCKHIRYPIGPICTKCLSDDFKWKKLSGKGKVFNYLIFHQKYNKAWGKETPYNVIMVQLEEGPKMFSNLINVDNNEIKIGMDIEVVFEKATDEVFIPKFRLAEK